MTYIFSMPLYSIVCWYNKFYYIKITFTIHTYICRYIDYENLIESYIRIPIVFQSFIASIYKAVCLFLSTVKRFDCKYILKNKLSIIRVKGTYTNNRSNAPNCTLVWNIKYVALNLDSYWSKSYAKEQAQFSLAKKLWYEQIRFPLVIVL